MARAPYVPPPRPSPEILQQIDYDAHGKIKFKTDLALWANGPSDFPVTFFHLGRYFQKPGAHARGRERARRARSSTTTPISTCRPNSPAHRLPDNSGFAGFRFQEARNGKLDWRKNDWVAFLGASYFRAIGELYQYGLSARGLAVDTAVFGKPEEFPDFTHVYFETPAPDSGRRHGLRPARRPERRRRLSASSCAAPTAVVMDIESRALPAPGRRAASASRR